MNIYAISYVQDDRFGLNAVCVAETSDEAVKVLNLGDDDTQVQVWKIGREIDGELSEAAHVVAHESL